MDLPENVLRLKKELRPNKDNIEMTFRHDMFDHIGEATLLNRVKSHKDVAERWYPDLLEVVAKKKEELRDKLTAPHIAVSVN